MQIIANITVSTKNMLDKDSNILLVPLYVFSLLAVISTIFTLAFSDVCEFSPFSTFTLAFSNVCEFLFSVIFL